MKIVFLLCFSVGLSQVCSPSQYFNGQRCAPCQLNCLCSSQYGCDSCLSGYTFDSLFLNCLPCPTATDSINVGCLQCCSQVSGPAFVCSKCVKGATLIGGQCIAFTGCSHLIADQFCSQCFPSYFYSQGACLPCHPSCSTCSDATACLSCAHGYYTETNFNGALCPPCTPPCLSCSAATTCLSCLTHYRLSASSCIACTPNCLSCNAISCIECNALSARIGSGCSLCSSMGCSTCTSNNLTLTCTSCQNGYFLQAGACTACPVRFPHSTLCTASSALQCLNDAASTLTNRYLLIGGTCVLNTRSCKEMLSVAGLCSTCYFTLGAYYSLSGGSCVQCGVNNCLSYSSSCACLSCLASFQFLNGLCVACQPLHCVSCTKSVVACEKCAVNYGLQSSACQQCSQGTCTNCDGNSSICLLCSNGYYLSQGQCYQCQVNCLTCSSNANCISCAGGYFLQSSGRCKQMPTHCLKVQESTNNLAICTKCDYGQMLQTGSCYPCSPSLFNLALCSDHHCPDYYLHAGRAFLLLLLLASF